MEKKLIYVINHVQAADTTHLYHVLNLLGMMSSRGWVIDLVSERGGLGVRDVAGYQVTYLSRTGHVLRAIRLAMHLVRQRIKGCRIVFVRISKSAAATSVVVGKLLGMKVLYWQSAANFDIDRKKAMLSRVRDDAVFAVIRRGVDAFVTGPEAMLKYYNKEYRVPKERLRLLYNDVDIGRFVSVPRCGKRRACRVLFVHRFSPIRETARYVPEIIRALNEAASKGVCTELCFVGDGPEENLVRQAATKASTGVDVKFLGAVPNRDLPEHYQWADVFIMPSYREGFPRVVIEAMASGLPIVTTDAGGTRDILGPLQQRYVVSRDDAGSFGDRLHELVINSDAQLALATENAEWVKRYSTEAVAEMLEKLLVSVVER